MKNALLKDTLREIRRTLSRFLSIFTIVAIGVSFFAGIKATSPDMKITADKYFDDYNLMDIKLLSTMGFDDKDIDAIKKTPNLLGVYPGYSMDVITRLENRDSVLKLISLPTDKIKTEDESYINRVKLVEGRYPQNPWECLAERGKMFSTSMSIGSKVKLSSGTEEDIGESLERNEFTIVGLVETPYYITFDRGTSTIGNGKVESFLMIPEENFKLPVFTEVFITVKGARDLFTYGDEYDDLIDPVKEYLEDTGEIRAKERYEEIVAEAREKIEDSKNELKEAEEKQRRELESVYRKLKNSERQIADGESELKNQEAEANRAIREGEAQIAAGYRELEAGELEYKKQLKAFEETKKQADIQFTNAEKQLQEAQDEIDKNQAEIDAMKRILATNPGLSEVERAQMEAAILLGQQQIDAARAQLQEERNKLEAEKQKLLQGEAELKAAGINLEKTRERLEIESIKLKAEKKRAEEEFEKARKKLKESKIKVKEGWEDYEKGKEESTSKIAEGYDKIADAEKELEELKEPEWYVLDRNMHVDFVDFGYAADRIDAVAKVFPVFFFLIAALVCLTTMTRMVDEQRVNIGTFKALGYSRFAIASKYLLYALLASLGGSIFGVLAGFRVFPTVIFNAYRIMYTMPDVITEFNTTYALISTAFAVLATTLAAWFACSKELMAEPAELMRPKSPKAGKRILLERIGFIWLRLNFTQKVTARNIFRYKKRFIMTILGIGGCTALLLAGFGLKDSIVSIASKQYDELYRYNMVIDLKEEASAENALKLEDNRITDYILVRQQNIDAGFKGIEKSVTLYVPEDISRFEEFIQLRNRETKEKVPFGEDGVIITEKLSRLLGISVGDELYIKDENNRRISIRVSGITENYVSHFIYMPKELYEKLYNKEIKFKQIVAKTTDTTEDFERNLSEHLLKSKDISSVSFITGISSSFKDMIGSLNYVILVLIVSAGALAFVVLYNLTNINVTERLREIATIKVLGFYDNEVSAYVYRENFLLTLIGMVMGLVLGIFFHKFIVVTTEIDYIMFGRNIEALSYVYSALLTIVFSGLVNFVMHFKLKKIGMVESLKSVD